jgi:hypothetical protein
MSTPTTALELRAAQEREYGQYIATGHIYVDGSLAFTEGHAVPVSHITSGLVSVDQVRNLKLVSAAVSVEKKV